MARGRAQSAMEYLMNYSWAVIIIMIVLGVMWSLGIFSGGNLGPMAQPGSCQVFRPDGPGTITQISLGGVCDGEIPKYVAHFNGQDSYIGMPNTVFPPGESLSSLTYVAWAYDSGLPSTMGGIIGAGTCNGLDCTDIEYNDGEVRFEQQGGNGGWDGFYSSNFKDKWVFFALTISGGNNEVDYVNGQIVAQNNANIGNVVFNYPGCCGAYEIGRWDTYFNGSIADVQIYDAALSANDIAALYHEGIGGAPIALQSLVAWWPLNGNINDYSGNDNNGTQQAVGFLTNWQDGYTPP